MIEEGSFKKYEIRSLLEARKPIAFSQKITVFISHKHDDLEELRGIIGFLQQEYGVITYIDSEDPSMPKKTNRQTAENLKKRIKSSDKFILLATNGAVNSKWCNWEVGYGDAVKLNDDNLVIFPLKPKGSKDSEYKGSEYLQLYPYIDFRDGTTKYSDGTIIERGYYVITTNEGGRTLTPLSSWIKRK